MADLTHLSIVHNDTLLGPCTEADYTVTDHGAVGGERSDHRSFPGVDAVEGLRQALAWLTDHGVLEGSD